MMMPTDVKSPVSDPTNLTTQQLTLAIQNVTAVFNTRLEAMDKAVELLQRRSDLRPTVGEVTLQYAEKFTSLDQRFIDLEKYGKSKLAEVTNIHITRIEGMEKRLDHKYVETATDIQHLRDLVTEKIKGIESRVDQSINDKFDLTDRINAVHFGKLEQQIVDQTSATALALSAADKAIDNAFKTAEKAVAKFELAAEKGYLESQITALKETFGSQIRTQKDALEAALAASDKAVLKAEMATEKRFESVNEFRATLSDQQSQLATKSEVNLRFKALEDRINAAVEDLREFRGKDLGATSATQDFRYERGVTREASVDNRGMIFGVIGSVIGFGALIVTIVLNIARGGVHP